MQRAHEAGAVVVADDAEAHAWARRSWTSLVPWPSVSTSARRAWTSTVCAARESVCWASQRPVAAARARAFELAPNVAPVLYPAVGKMSLRYRPQRVRDLVDSTRVVGRRLLERLGDWWRRPRSSPDCRRPDLGSDAGPEPGHSA